MNKVLLVKKVLIGIALVFIIAVIVAYGFSYHLTELSRVAEKEENLKKAYKLSLQDNKSLEEKLTIYRDANFELIRDIKDLESDIKAWEACAERRRTERLKAEEMSRKFNRAFEVLKKEAKETKKSKPKSSIVEIIPKIKPGVVHIQCPGWQLSGFVISENIIVTARHGVEGVEDFVITTNDGHKLHATRAISSEKHDVAFIYIDDLTCQPEKEREIECNKVKHKVKLYILELGSITECQLGQELITIGSPYGKINFNSITLGIISGLDRNYNPLNDSYYGYNDYGWSVAFQTDSPGHPGNSGCAVFTADGVVRGILVGGFSPSLIIAMPMDIVLGELEVVKHKFISDKYYCEEEEKESIIAWDGEETGLIDIILGIPGWIIDGIFK